MTNTSEDIRYHHVQTQALFGLVIAVQLWLSALLIAFLSEAPEANMASVILVFASIPFLVKVMADGKGGFARRLEEWRGADFNYPPLSDWDFERPSNTPTQKGDEPS